MKLKNFKYYKDGWKGFMKLCIYILKVNEKKILQMDFDGILSFLHDFTKSDIFSIKFFEENNPSNEVFMNLEEKISSLPIKEKYLKYLEKEYEQVIMISIKKLDSFHIEKKNLIK